MRKLLSLLLALFFVTAFSGCSKTAPSSNEPRSVGDGDGDSPSGPGGQPDSPAGPSRLEGLAPLYVYFDLTGEYKEDYIGKTFHWNFDATNVDHEGRHEVTSGFVAGHVYQKPGQYRARCQVYAEDGTPGRTHEWTVEVGAFSGEIIYVAEDGDDANPGTIEAPIRSIREALAVRAGRDKTILFRNGDTFEFGERVQVGGPGPVLIGRYSDPERPSSDRPTWISSNQDLTYMVQVASSDWRITGIRLTAGGYTTEGPAYPSGMVFADDAQHNLIQDVEFVELGTIAVSLRGDANAIFDSEFHTLGRTGVYSSGDTNQRHSVVGNRIYDFRSDHPEHVLRVQGGSGLYIAHNYFQATDNKSNLQIRGNSSKVVVYGNVLDRASAFNPQNATSEEYIHHAIFDSNICIGRTSGLLEADYPIRANAFTVTATDVVVRNNIFYNYLQPLVVGGHNLVGGSANVGIYNNTFLCFGVSCQAIRVCATCSDVTIRNNLMYAPSQDAAQQYRFLRLDGGTLDGSSDFNAVFGETWTEDARMVSAATIMSFSEWRTSGNDLNSIYAAPALQAPFLDETATENMAFSIDSLRDVGAFMPAETSPVVDAGINVGGALDFYGRLRRNTHEIGGVEFQE